MPAASRQEGRAGDGAAGLAQRAGRAAAGRAAAMPFSLTLPAPPTGGGGGTQHEPGAQRPTTLSFRAASPPGDHSGAERPGGRADARPTRPGRPRPIDSGTCCRHDAYSRRAGCWSGPAPEGTGAGIPASRRTTRRRRPTASACLVPAPTGPSWPHRVLVAGIVPAGSFQQARYLRAATSDFFSDRGSLRSRRRRPRGHDARGTAARCPVRRAGRLGRRRPGRPAGRRRHSSTRAGRAGILAGRRTTGRRRPTASAGLSPSER